MFLNMISSTLIEDVQQGTGVKSLVLLGFSLVAAISSTAFIKTVSDRVLASIREIKKKADEAADKADKADDKAAKAEDKAQRADQKAGEALNEAQDASQALGHAVESEPSEEGGEESRSDSLEAARELAAVAFTPDEAAALKALTESRFLLRSASGLAAELYKSRAEVVAALQELERRELVVPQEYRGGVRWAATERGRRAQR